MAVKKIATFSTISTSTSPTYLETLGTFFWRTRWIRGSRCHVVCVLLLYNLQRNHRTIGSQRRKQPVHQFDQSIETVQMARAIFESKTFEGEQKIKKKT